MLKTDQTVLSLRLQENLQMILEENLRLIRQIDYETMAELIPLIRKANHIFLAGAGRSGLALRAAAMRLMHFGLRVYVVGETTTPAIQAGDLLIAASGSGTTSSIVSTATKAVKMGAQVVAMTTTKDSAFAKLATLVLILPAAQKQDHGKSISAQYAGSLFEQGLLFLTDAVFQTLWDIDHEAAEDMWKRHANLE